jgi:hypothetical protein
MKHLTLMFLVLGSNLYGQVTFPITPENSILPVSYQPPPTTSASQCVMWDGDSWEYTDWDTHGPTLFTSWGLNNFDGTWASLTGKPSTFTPSVHNHTIAEITGLQNAIDAKQATLVSGTNIKTVNGITLLGAGDITVGGSVAWGSVTGTLSSQTDLQNALNAKQATLVSGTNIRTIEGQTLLGSTNIDLGASDVGLGNVTNESKTTMFASPTFTGTVSGVTAAHVGLGNVNNTSDLNKPVSIATQTALDTKHPDITFQEEGVGLGSAGTATTVNFTGAGTASFAGNTLTVNIPAAGLGDAVIANGLQQFTGTTNANFVNQTTVPTTPSSGNVRLYSQDDIGKIRFVDANGRVNRLEEHSGFSNQRLWLPSSGTGVSAIGSAPTNSGTVSNPTLATTSLKTSLDRFTVTSATTAGALAYNRSAKLEVFRGNAAGRGGFNMVATFSLSTLQTGNRFFVGLSSTANVNPTNIDPLTSTAGSKVGLAFNLSTGNLQLVNNVNLTAPTVLDLGASFPVNNTNVYRLQLFAEPNGSSINYIVENLTTPATASGSLATNIPANTDFLGRVIWMTNNTIAASVAYDVSNFFLENKIYP